jgi:hypothetical protein
MDKNNHKLQIEMTSKGRCTQNIKSGTYVEEPGLIFPMENS